MRTLSEWLPLATSGATFTLLGLLKLYGLSKGIQGGGCKPWSQRVCGSCPSWSRTLNILVTALFLAIGLVNLARLAWLP